MSRPPLAGGDQARTEPEPFPPNSTTAHTQDIRAERANMLRDFIGETLEPVERDILAARLCLRNDDDTARYHLKRIVKSVKAAATTFGELQEIVGGRQ